MPDTDATQHEWAKVEAGYAHVEMMRDRADDKANLLWHGWALREAFVAGAEWQETRTNPPTDATSSDAPERMWITPNQVNCGWLAWEQSPPTHATEYVRADLANPDAQARHAADERIAVLTEALSELESANEAVCALRSQEVYLAMIAIRGTEAALGRLDSARYAARAALGGGG